MVPETQAVTIIVNNAMPQLIAVLINGDSLCSWNCRWFLVPRFLLKENG